jgi:hypothetical protein
LKTSRKVEITIQTDRRLVIRGSVTTQSWCHQCGSETEAVSLETAGVVAEALAAGVEGRFFRSELHFLPTEDDGTQVCLRSLLELVRTESDAARSARSTDLSKKK